ncbi:four-carbon acid sugar kinase family protein [Phyllobacterium chamaecytisi]|uniref:four-carbon acid sugar kinase family protein n=1 Tax=Phyllobacterium chamaecytisi TaxID=2876082 RepID=UPI001CC92D8A|nr:four-carbon acid sugar kinase family protein [Phyllobacterium sp. KW56]MBZ9605451.1 four-carbon acid sugar kinase family protein [Phyllobacterium sp. KW56]
MTEKTQIAFYGDDFTGSTDAMEALSSNGIETVLFTGIPDDARLKAFNNAAAVGLAGTSRSQTPEWMDRELPRIFAWLRSLRAPICHYKVCSTFDSSPAQGSIGRAIDIGLETFKQEAALLIVGVPQLGRYTMFGELFARFRGEVFRIDRHPVMSRHPSTPMHEADLRRHLAQQTRTSIGLVELPALLAGDGSMALRKALDEDHKIIMIDVADLLSLRCAGALIDANLGSAAPLIFGSSGVEYAYIETLRAGGNLAPAASSSPLLPQERIAVVSGSCSPTTEMQIRYASSHGFEPIEVDYAALATGAGSERAETAAFDTATAVLTSGRSPLLFTALGKPSIQPITDRRANDRVGRRLGALLNRLTAANGLKRVVVAGGDTSSHALSELHVGALTLRHPIAQSPGSPVCLGHRFDGSAPLELVLKGGQIGNEDFFVRIRDGRLD